MLYMFRSDTRLEVAARIVAPFLSMDAAFFSMVVLWIVAGLWALVILDLKFSFRYVVEGRI